MKYFSRLLTVAFFFMAGSASAQNAGTVSNHAIAVGKGAGVGGMTSVSCADQLLLAGRAGLDPACRALIAADLPTVPLTKGGLGSDQSAATANQIPVYPGSGGAAVPKTGPTWFDTAFCNTAGFIIARLSGSWQCAQGIPIPVTWLGAKGDCSTSDTAAVQAAYNAVVANGGVIRFPGVASCYLVGAINGTNKSGIILEGAGDNSTLKITGQDASGNWLDISGSSHVTIRNLKIIDDGGTTIPKNLIFWFCTGTTGSCATSGILGGLAFDHVTIAAKSSMSFLYANGFGNTGGSAGNAKAGGGSLSITNSTWTNTNNGPSSANPWSRNAPLHIDCINSTSQTSAYVTIPANGQATTCSGVTLVNAYLVDAPAAFIGTHTFDNNAGLVMYNANAFTMIGGSVQCLCDSLNVIWSNTQGATWNGTLFNASDGGSPNLNYSVNIGGGINAAIGFYDVFWPVSLGPPIAIDQGIGAALGGAWNLTVINNNLGTSLSTPFVGKTANGCGSFTATNNWLIAANLQFLAGGNNIATCGSIDANSILQQAGTITIPGSSVDNSTHIGQTSNGSWTPVDASGAGLVFTGVSANWTRVGNMIYAYASLTYPATANGANAALSGLPVTAAAPAYGQQCSLTYTTVATAVHMRAANGGVGITPYNATGGNITNTAMSGAPIQFICIYPAS
jgi:hypothetical protein